MSDLPDTAADTTTGTADDWLPDVPEGKTAPLPKAPKRPQLRPVEALAAEIEGAPIAAEGRAQPDTAPQDSVKPPRTPPEAEEPPPPGREKRPRGTIWKDCPVKPLGVNGGVSYYLDIHGQMRPVAKHDAQTIMHLFGHMIPRLCLNFPLWDAKAEAPKKHRFDQTKAAMEMMQACSEKGLFDPDGAVRGVGAWVDDDGFLVYHTGDSLLVGSAVREPAEHQGRIYPAYPPIPHPAVAGKDADPAPALLDRLATWQWTRPDIDPMITLGMLGIQMMGGALDWRPTFWVTGGKASGKSSFQNLIKHVHGGDKGLIQSNDATKSGLTSRIGHSSLPVALDELEPGDEGSRKEADIIVLARTASSGGQWFRGSADQKGAGGNVYSTFLFSSILIPGALKSQDLSRLVVLSLQPFPEGTPAPTLRAEEWRKRGAALKRVLIDRWPSWRARLDLWREAFAEHGIGGRNADNWATICAMAQMAQAEAMPAAEELTGWTSKVAKWIKGDVAEIGSDADEMLLHLLSQGYDIYRRGEQFTVAQWLMVAAGLPGAPRSLLDGYDMTSDQGREQRRKEANSKLARAGMRVIGHGPEAVLFLASNQIQGLKDLFQRSQWANGVWTQSAARIKGAKFGRDTAPRRLEGIQTRGVEIPFSSMPGLMAFPADQVAAPSAPQDDTMEGFA